jgi:hypothetical protein
MEKRNLSTNTTRCCKIKDALPKGRCVHCNEAVSGEASFCCLGCETAHHALKASSDATPEPSENKTSETLSDQNQPLSTDLPEKTSSSVFSTFVQQDEEGICSLTLLLV